jgi:hypothetical protein
MLGSPICETYIPDAIEFFTLATPSNRSRGGREREVILSFIYIRRSRLANLFDWYSNTEREEYCLIVVMPYS